MIINLFFIFNQTVFFLKKKGEVDKLLLMKPIELTNYFEMISGSIS